MVCVFHKVELSSQQGALATILLIRLNASSYESSAVQCYLPEASDIVVCVVNEGLRRSSRGYVLLYVL